ncbi:MAG TPA: SIS domain-containing protein [Candidatus Sumerlaeota bacterium]|nr:MAG: Phosphoheptose isomerase [candidate division BRC1 bacterium ADurb.BinA292]HOE97267.1 SIS domain-containing protein [Candidatus Sumerlaeota bacterium]HOR28776.1 SIS domain-containing protein [Candidatus Sumerlaeota bacterium]HPK02713.1 SIS domain-containing protein [Candidatus Sumerlaeota bacterium]
MHPLAQMFTQSASPADYARAYFRRLAALMDAVDPDAIQRAVEAFETVCREGRSIYAMANGGSAAVASHLVNDAVAGAFCDAHPPLRAWCLSDNIETVTALANDCGFDQVYERQLMGLMAPGDLVLALSVSGNSPNLVRAMQYARDHGARTMAWTGMAGGRLGELAEIHLHLPCGADEYGPVEDMFSVLEHVLMTWLTQKRGRWLHH